MSEEFRSSAPEPLAPAPFNIPDSFRTQLDNGLKVVIFEDKRLPLVSLRLAFFTGDAYEPEKQTGVTSALAAM
ncbi:MAG: hypothetical protein ACREO5_06510, partial [Candidatus Binatia bacterium]